MGLAEVHILSLQVSAGGATLGCNHPAEAMEHRVCDQLLSSFIKSLIFTLLLLVALLQAPLFSTGHSKPQVLLFPRVCHQGEKSPSSSLGLLSSQQFPAEGGCSSKAEKGQEQREQKNFY